MKLYLVTGTTQNYIPNIIPYLKSIEKHSNFDENILMCIDFKSKLDNNSRIIKDLHLSLDEVQSFSCKTVQHGEFLNHKFFDSLNDEDIICFTDGDILMQRPLNSSEILLFKNIKDDEILLQINGYLGEPLSEEYKKLSPVISYANLCTQVGGVPDNYSVFNMGVIIANKKTWASFKQKYLELFKINDSAFKNTARIQWLESFITNKYFKPIIMPPTIHTHFHGGPVENSSFKDDVLYIKDEICLFPHFCYVIPENPQYPFLNKFDYLNFQRKYIKKHIE